MDKNNEITKKDYEVLKDKKIAVIGCGGLGGYVLEMLARFEVDKIVIVDDEVVNESNLGRQVMSNHLSLGKYKVNEAVLWIKQVNPFIYVKGVIERINKGNAKSILKEVDMVIDCVDNIETKFVLQDTCEKLNIPLIHGAVESWKGQASTILPGDKTLDKIYDTDERKNKKIKKSSFIPATVASYQVSECIKVFLGKGNLLRSKIIYVDMFTNETIVKDLI